MHTNTQNVFASKNADENMLDGAIIDSDYLFWFLGISYYTYYRYYKCTFEQWKLNKNSTKYHEGKSDCSDHCYPLPKCHLHHLTTKTLWLKKKCHNKLSCSDLKHFKA